MTVGTVLTCPFCSLLCACTAMQGDVISVLRRIEGIVTRVGARSLEDLIFRGRSTTNDPRWVWYRFCLVRLWTKKLQHDEVAYSFFDVDDQSLDLLMMWKELLVIIGRMLHRYERIRSLLRSRQPVFPSLSPSLLYCFS